MTQPRCTATTNAGVPCQAFAAAASDRCGAHDPESRARRAEAFAVRRHTRGRTLYASKRAALTRRRDALTRRIDELDATFGGGG